MLDHPSPRHQPLQHHPLPQLSAQHTAAAQQHTQSVKQRASTEHGFYGTWTLLLKELHRFFVFAGQTLASPVLTTILWYLVFGYSFGDRLAEINGIPYTDFLIPGLVMMSVIMNAFMNSSFSFFVTKIHGNLVDLLVSPLHPWQLIFAYTVSSIVRAVLVGIIIWVIAALMGANTVHHMGWTIAFLLLTSAAFALLGFITGILAKDFDHINFIPSFLLMPLTFLGGVFYSVNMLPEPWNDVSRFNPVVYMVNGLRYGMTGYADVPLWTGVWIVSATVVSGFLALILLLRSGYGLKD